MNMLKTLIFLIISTIIIVVLANLIAGHDGLYVGVIIAALMDYFAFFKPDQVMLNLFKAKQIEADSHPDIHAILQTVATKISAPRPKLYLIPKTTSPNIFVVGRTQKNASIAVTESFLTALSTEEQTAVIAQAFAQIHLQNHFLNSVVTVVADTISGLASIGWEAVFDDKDPHEKPHFNETTMKFFGPIAGFILKTNLSPDMTFAADALSAQWIGNTDYLISALEKIESLKVKTLLPIADARPATTNLFFVNPIHPKKWARMFNRHPATSLRVERLRNL